MTIFLTFFQLTPELTEKLLLVVLPSAIAAVITHFATRRTQTAAAGKTTGEIVGMWQNKYFGLLEKLEDLRDKSETVENELDEAKRKLRGCLHDNGDCREIIQKINVIFSQTEVALNDLIEYAALVSEIQNLKKRIDAKKTD